MKKKSSNKTLNKKNRVKAIQKSIPKSIIRKLGMLLGAIIPIAILISYSMNVNFFSITEFISIFVLIISIAAYLKDEIIYSHPKTIHNGNVAGNKKIVVSKKNKINLSFSLNKGTVQVVLSIVIILALTYLVQVIYNVVLLRK